jgi:hypothetical protein
MEWQPIETAPHGKQVLVLCEGLFGEPYYDIAIQGGSEGPEWYNKDCIPCEPVRWFPLPLVPTE